jgi:hypothetical protein
MYFAPAEIDRLWCAVQTEGAARPLHIARPFARPLATEAAVLETLKRWADAARRGQAGVDIEQIDRHALPHADDRTLDQCINRLERNWTGDWYAYINDVQRYDGDLWERAVEILLPAIRRQGLPAGGFKMELFFGKYGATPTGIHLDTSDNLAFILRGPKRMLFWPPGRFPSLRKIPANDAPQQEQALTRDYAAHRADAIELVGETGDVFYWPKEYWHVGASSEGWTTMVTIPMWWNARPGTVARFILDRALGLDGEPRGHVFNPDEAARDALTMPASVSGPVAAAAAQINANLQPAARLVWASLASSYGFTVPPGRADIAAPLTERTPERLKYPIVAFPGADATTLLACGHQVRTSLDGVGAAVADLNETRDGTYALGDVVDRLAGADAAPAVREEGWRVSRELLSSRSLQTIND